MVVHCCSSRPFWTYNGENWLKIALSHRGQSRRLIRCYILLLSFRVYLVWLMENTDMSYRGNDWLNLWHRWLVTYMIGNRKVTVLCLGTNKSNYCQNLRHWLSSHVISTLIVKFSNSSRAYMGDFCNSVSSVLSDILWRHYFEVWFYVVLGRTMETFVFRRYLTLCWAYVQLCSGFTRFVAVSGIEAIIEKLQLLDRVVPGNILILPEKKSYAYPMASNSYGVFDCVLCWRA